LKSDFKAASVLERLSTSLTDAEIDYQACQGVHEFIVVWPVCDTSWTQRRFDGKKNDMDLSGRDPGDRGTCLNSIHAGSLHGPQR